MTRAYYQTIQGMIRSLNSLKGIISKVPEFAKENGMTEQEVLTKALVSDMFNLTRQVQIACDNLKGAASRFTKAENPSHEDNEVTSEELIARIDKVIEFANSFKEEDFADAQTSQVVLPWMKHVMPGKFLFAEDYLYGYAIPNYYFHLVTAYGILRGLGMKIGKMDFVSMQGIELGTLEA